MPPQHTRAIPETASPIDDGDLFTSISCTVHAAARRTLPPRWRLAPTTLPHYRIYVGLSGSASFVVAGESHSLVPGGVILVPPGVTHSARSAPETPLDVVSIDFEAKLHGILDVPEFCGLPVSLSPTGIQRRKTIACAQTIARFFSSRPPGYHFALHGQCIRLLSSLHHETVSQLHHGAGRALARTADLRRFRPVFQLVEQRFGERLTLADLAAAVHLNPSYFSDIFKRAAGVGPHEYVSRYRLERACDLLVASDTPLHEIARRTGFCDAAHLVRLFRRFHGTSPGQFRRARSRPSSLAPI